MAGKRLGFRVKRQSRGGGVCRGREWEKFLGRTMLKDVERLDSTAGDTMHPLKHLTYFNQSL